MADESEHSTKDSLGERMKCYEAVTHHHLTRRCPVIVRVDGRAFHTWTRGLGRPFDQRIVFAMLHATIRIVGEIQGCKLAYTQSDEASFLLTDFDTLETQPWFGYDLAKVISMSASIMTAAFNIAAYDHGLGTVRHVPATFDARAFNVPREDIPNYFLWRAMDWQRNSVQMLAQAHFSPKELYRKRRADMIQMLAAIGHSWEALEPRLKYGSFVVPPDLDYSTVEPQYTTVAAMVNGAIQSVEVSA